MFLVDANVLVYAANHRAPEHATCRELLRRWRTESRPWCTTWGILYEFLRVATHPRVMQRPWTMNDAVGLVRGMLASPGLAVLEHTARHEALLSETLAELPEVRGSQAHDLHTAVLMREHGIRRIVTRDTGFQRFPFLEVVDPITDTDHDVVRERPSAAAAKRTGRRKAVRY